MVNLVIGLLCLTTVSSAEIKNDLAFITEVNPVYAKQNVEQDTSTFTFRQTSETGLALSSLIRLYQLYVSPQGPPSCNFTVTCSDFMIGAIQKHGIAHGVLMTSDRLMRCTRGGRRYYSVDPETGHAIDYPVETYFLPSSERCSRKGQ